MFFADTYNAPMPSAKMSPSVSVFLASVKTSTLVSVFLAALAIVHAKASIINLESFMGKPNNRVLELCSGFSLIW